MEQYASKKVKWKATLHFQSEVTIGSVFKARLYVNIIHAWGLVCSGCRNQALQEVFQSCFYGRKKTYQFQATSQCAMNLCPKGLVKLLQSVVVQTYSILPWVTMETMSKRLDQWAVSVNSQPHTCTSYSIRKVPPGFFFTFFPSQQLYSIPRSRLSNTRSANMQ